MHLKISIYFIALFVSMSFICSGNLNNEGKNELSVAFYNLDNLFDVFDDSSHNDDEFTPGGKYKWDKNRFQSKLKNLEKVISQIADGNTPDVLGVCELESASALNDLLDRPKFKSDFDFVHYDSEDERGIDVALIYNKKKIKVLESRNYRVKLNRDTSDRTRDVLWVKTISTISNDTMQFIVCHFPSRRAGKVESEPDRMDAATTCKSIIGEKCNTATQNLILLGDFNDQPWDKSMTKGIGASGFERFPNSQLFNLMFDITDKSSGSYFFRGHWEKLDQIVVSRALRDGNFPDYKSASVSIMKMEWMLQTGKYAGQPLRTFGGNKWLNGYSDHLPVYMYLKLKDDKK